MNKTAMVTLWVDPAEHQIVKYTFDNVWMDFLPGAWLVRVDDIHASMTMGQPFPGIWLPREMNVHAGVTVAIGSFEASYDAAFADYKRRRRHDEDRSIRQGCKRQTAPRTRPHAPELADVAWSATPETTARTTIQQPETIARDPRPRQRGATDADVIALAGLARRASVAPEA